MARRIKAAHENRRPKGADVNRRWQQIIDDHVRFLRDEYWNGWRSWRAALYLSRAKHWSEQLKNSDRLNYAADLIDDVATVPLISMHIENMVGFLTQSDPEFVGTPRRAEDVGSHEVQQTLLNYRWRELDIDDQHAMALRDMVTIGHGIIGTGFAFERELAGMVPAKATYQATTNYDDGVRAGEPYARRVNPFMFLKDRYAADGTIKTARWVAEIFCRPLDDIKQDANYDKVDLDRIKTLHSWRTENEYIYNAESEDYGSEDIGVLVKLYDKRYRVFRILGMGVDDPLLEAPWPYEYLDGFPYVMRDFVRLPNEVYGVGFPYFAAHQQLLLDRIATKMSQHARKHNAKYIARGFGDDDDQLDVFENDEHGSLLRGGQSGEIMPVAAPQFGQDLFQIHQVTENNLRRLMAEDQLAAGANLPARTSAEEVRTRNRLFGAKLKEVVRSSERLLRDTARQVLQHIKANAEPGEIVRIVGPGGVRFVQLSDADIKAEVDIEVTAVAREATDPVTRREQSMGLLNQLTQLVPVINQAEMQKAQMQQAAGQPITARLLDVDYNQLLHAAVKTFDDREFDRAFPEAPAAPIAPTPVQQVPGAGPPTAAGPQDATQSAQQSARPQPGR